ncbi:hypothetical protein ABZP36_030442 [Zizania latifolia]
MVQALTSTDDSESNVLVHLLASSFTDNVSRHGGEEEGEGEREEDNGGDGELACTAEVSLEAVGMLGAPPTPTPHLSTHTFAT